MSKETRQILKNQKTIMMGLMSLGIDKNSTDCLAETFKETYELLNPAPTSSDNLARNRAEAIKLTASEDSLHQKRSKA